MSAFDDTLKAAVTDIMENGYDEARLLAWTQRLTVALVRSVVPMNEVLESMRMELERRYKGALVPAKIDRTHPGITPFTLAQVSPGLRAQLDERILASANLIKLNHEDSIRRTLQRFSGWATSIPVSGSTAQDKRKVARELKRGFASLPFTERRVVIDQGHKLTASINAVLAQDAGAIAAVWNSHWRELNYDYRRLHKKYDKQLFLIRDSWAHKDGLIRPAGHQYTDQIEAPAEMIFCRCWYTYLHRLNDLPDAMITAKGKEYLLRRRRAA
ncbi:MAG: hypothetical protein ACRESI_06555 [Gammaproteobacteria bacterium]